MTGEEFRKIRILKRLSQREFAEKLDVSRSSIFKWEREGVPEEKEDWVRNALDMKGPIVNDAPEKYNKLTLEKFGISFTIKEVALFVAQNQEAFMKEDVFSNMIDSKAIKLTRELMLLTNVKK